LEVFPKRANGPGDFLPASASLRTRKHTNEEEHASETITGVALAATNHERDEALAFAERLKSIQSAETAPRGVWLEFVDISSITPTMFFFS
jgi:hypothetical protein